MSYVRSDVMRVRVMIRNAAVAEDERCMSDMTVGLKYSPEKAHKKKDAVRTAAHSHSQIERESFSGMFQSFDRVSKSMSLSVLDAARSRSPFLKPLKQRCAPNAPSDRTNHKDIIPKSCATGPLKLEISMVVHDHNLFLEFLTHIIAYLRCHPTIHCGSCRV